VTARAFWTVARIADALRDEVTGAIPRDASSRQAAMLTARIAGCVFSVSFS